MKNKKISFVTFKKTCVYLEKIRQYLYKSKCYHSSRYVLVLFLKMTFLAFTPFAVILVLINIPEIKKHVPWSVLQRAMHEGTENVTDRDP